MIHLLETRNFRMLVGNSVGLRRFQVLVGQNATGKSTLLGALQLVADVLAHGARAAVERVAPSFDDLCFERGEPVALAVELTVANGEPGPRRLRYEIELGIDGDEGLKVLRENLFILPADPPSGTASLQKSLFGEWAPNWVFHEQTPSSWRKVVSKTREGRDYFRDEKTEWNNVFRFGPDRAALGSLPEDPDRFPLSIAARNLLRDGVRTVALGAREMRSPSPPGSPRRLAMDGSNLPHAVLEFQQRDPVLFADWVDHLALAVEGLEEVTVRERAEDKHLVLEARFAGRHAQPVPTWTLSDGTLRLMALTLLSYAATGDEGVFLVEEPENGLHPLAIQSAYDALSDPRAPQILCATHSPIFLAQTRLEETLVFRRAPQGWAEVRRGPEIAELGDWSERVDVQDLVDVEDLVVTGVVG